MIELHPVTGLPEIGSGVDLAALISEHTELRDGDILVVAQKVVSKAEGRLRDMRTIEPSEQAKEIAIRNGADPRQVQAVIDESVRLVRTERVIIAETRHGFICANAGVDHSNVPGGEILCLLPVDPDASAAALRERLREVTGKTVAVIVSDTFGRAWRIGIANVALGVAGMPAVVDYRGRDDDFGRTMVGTVVAISDELAGAAELAMGKTDRVPVVVIRGYRAEGEPGDGRSLVRPAAEDMFR
ncbi:MAG TPA: coenzyme F420-0:L-glutamate ligase [Candidatus Dormibacteraeota bacterium]|nr:coenzyme F420-0:L-glutamate ligase [Candidatus Dormibacteraeota bacterium]